jgi:hydroxyacylglutathione hydrolase
MPGHPTDSAILSAPVQVIVLEMSCGTLKNYNYLVVDRVSGRAVIVDPAWELDKIEQARIRAGARLHGVLVTHSHPDHIHLASTVSELYHCPIWMPEEEIRLSHYRAARLAPVQAPQCWAVGAMQVHAIATPGHTPGSVCYRVGDSLFTGDTLFAEGCGICPDTPAAFELYHSLQRLKAQLPADTRVYPGHCYGKPPGERFAQLLQENIYLQFTNPESFAAFRMRKSWRVANLFGQ